MPTGISAPNSTAPHELRTGLTITQSRKTNWGMITYLESLTSPPATWSLGQYKAVLPRATDFITDVLALQANAAPGEEVEAFVCDAEEL